MNRIEVETEKGHIVGRNGAYNIKAISVSSFSDLVYIDGIGKRGVAIHGGLVVTREAFDKLVNSYLKERDNENG